MSVLGRPFCIIGRKFDRIWCYGRSSRTCFTLLSKGLGARGMFLSSLPRGDAVAAESCSGQYRHCLILCLLAKTDQKTYLFFTFLLAGLGLSVFFLADFGAGSLETVHRLIVGLLTSDSSVSQDVPFFESIFDRVTALPLETLSFYGSEILVLGAGVFGEGVLGYAQYPMAHNGIVELLCIYGFIFGGLAVLCYCCFLSTLYFCLSSGEEK